MERPRRRLSQTGQAPLPRATYYRSGGRPSGQRSPFEPASHPKQSSRHWLRLADVAFIVFLIGLLGWSLYLSGHAKVLASDLSYHSLADYKASTARYLEHVRNRNKVTFDDKAISEALRRDYPEIDTVKVELPVFSSTPVVRLNIAAPSFFIRENSVDYIVDSNGRLVAPKSRYPQVKNLPLLIDESGYQARPGLPVIGKPGVEFIKRLISQCRKNHVDIKSMSLPATPEELDLRTADKPYFVKFYLSGDADIQIGQFLAARAQFVRKNIQPTAYLDVRVSGKVFYK